MGLLTIVRKHRRKEREIRVLVLGLDNAGKTTIVRRLKGEKDLSKVKPTLGFNIDTLMHKNFSLNIWDIGGQTSLRAYWRNYFESTDSMVWVIDSVDRERLNDTKFELDKLLLEERLQGASLLVFANKQDLDGSLSISELEDVLDLKSKSKSHNWKILDCSAIEGTNLTEGLDWIVDEAKSRLYVLD
ncbi:ADP-ribosylation factor-like 2 [Phakopsora pachyrhizi]|uniref:ADP-ribosylation factor-like 2 n=1 Tax=Phakopsora pachyrhizi TaxID=170000 RepID=A0AAV0BDB1_PHAPC|nr:ADP-ribosylation factor-like 2 [Phakopsora pachyrhizi]CAH7684302.1 ADP-ribosylation factor-like 2 [Phakopsora pachyrhizi]